MCRVMSGGRRQIYKSRSPCDIHHMCRAMSGSRHQILKLTNAVDTHHMYEALPNRRHQIFKTRDPDNIHLVYEAIPRGFWWCWFSRMSVVSLSSAAFGYPGWLRTFFAYEVLVHPGYLWRLFSCGS